MFAKRIYLLVLGIVFCLTNYSQSNLDENELDSLLHVFNDTEKSDSIRLKAIDYIAWDGYLYTQPDSSFFYAQMQYDFAKSKKRKKDMALAHNTQGAALDKKGDYIYAIEYYKKSLEIRLELQDKRGTAASLNNIGSIYRNQGDDAKALQFFLESLKLKEELGDKKGIANSMLGIGNVLKEQENYSGALEYFQKSYDIRVEIGDKKGMANSVLSIGNIYWLSKDYDKALEFFQESLALQDEIGNQLGVANCLNNIGVIYKDKEELDKAMNYFNKSLALRIALDDKLGELSTYRNIGTVYLAKGDFKQAVDFATKSLVMAKDIGALKKVEDASAILYEIYKKSHKFDNALSMYENYIEIRDSLLSEENHKQITELQYQFQYAMKANADSIKNDELKKILEIENDKQKAIADKKSAEADVLKNRQLALFGGLGLVVLFSIYIYSRFRVIKSQKLIIEKQKKEVEIQREFSEKQKNYAELQKHIVEEKNREISDSIIYAKRIQEAILPSRYSLKENLKNGFVFFKPKDIVSGDFYWLEHYNKVNNENSGTVFFAAADCTGHGVPGAMVSVVCSNALSKALLEENITDTGKLLDRTRELVIQRFSKSDNEVRDGMDISICRISKDNKQLQWAGANNPLWIINPNRNSWPVNAIPFADCDFGREIKANNQPIGNYEISEPFQSHSIDLVEGDTLYVFTDGFQDQFGGVKGKKFKSVTLKKLLTSIYDKSMDEQKQILDSELLKWMGEHEQIDDICIIGVRV